MKYLVTGGLGVIGSYIVRRLAEAGHPVAVLDSCEEHRNEWTRVELEKLDTVTVVVRRMESLGLFLHEGVKRADAVIHCAAHTGIPHSLIDPHDDWRSNVDATRDLLEALRAHPRPTVVLSSIKPYQVTPMPPLGLDETAVLSPDEPYAASKAAQSMLCQAYSRSFELPVVTFRCSNLYGPAPCHGPRHGWLTWFCISAAIGRPIEVQGTGEQSRDMLHATDVYSACKLALDNAEQLGGEIFNLGGGITNQITVGLAARTLRELSGVAIVMSPPRPMDDDRVFVDCRKFGSLGWAPTIAPSAGIRDVYSWAYANREALKEIYKGV